MDATTESIGKLLSRQHRQLPYGNHLSEQSFTFTFDQVHLPVTVVMERMMLPVPKSEVVFTGRAYLDKATVSFPENEKTRQVFENYFINSTVPHQFSPGGIRHIYSHVLINGRQLLISSD